MKANKYKIKNHKIKRLFQSQKQTKLTQITIYPTFKMIVFNKFNIAIKRKKIIQINNKLINKINIIAK